MKELIMNNEELEEITEDEGYDGLSENSGIHHDYGCDISPEEYGFKVKEGE